MARRVRRSLGALLSLSWMTVGACTTRIVLWVSFGARPTVCIWLRVVGAELWRVFALEGAFLGGVNRHAMRSWSGRMGGVGD